MTLFAEISADLAIFYNTSDFARSAVYTPISGFKKTVAVIVSSDPANEYRGADAYGQVKRVRVRADASLGVGLPVHGDALKIGSVDYEVQDANEMNDGLEWELIISKA
jgi:hypothetical protein